MELLRIHQLADAHEYEDSPNAKRFLNEQEKGRLLIPGASPLRIGDSQEDMLVSHDAFKPLCKTNLSRNYSVR